MTVKRRVLLGLAGAALVPELGFAQDDKKPPEKAPEKPPDKPPDKPPVEEGPPPNRDRSVAENYQLPVEGSDLVIGGAVIGVNTTLDAVKKVLLSFRRYKDILPRLEQSRLVAEENGSVDVYMRAPLLHGLGAIWGIAHFPPIEPWRGRGIQLRGEFVKGNLKKWNARWMAFPCGGHRTLLKIEMFADIDLPVPVKWITDELLRSCRDAVTAVRDIAETECAK